jgi:DNA repair exonuclease SbcCD ATPase subunit
MCAEVCAITGVVSNQVAGPRLLTRLAALLLFGMTAAPWVVLAQSEPGGTGELRTADEEFSKQLGELRKTFSDLSKKFEDSAQTIERLNSAEAARQEIEELRDAVGQLLGAVADNGTVWSLGAKALSHAEAKLKSLEQETRYKQEDKQFLLERWRDLKVATEGAIRELESARKDFAELLRKLQTSEDFIDELLQIREHQRALDVIHKLTDGIRDASDKLKKLLGTIKTPGA